MRIKAQVKTKLTLMVKADAYGHGLTEVAKYVVDIVDGFGVATLEEGVKLRKNGIKKSILLLICPANEMQCAVQNRLTIGLSNALQLAELERLVSSQKIIPRDIKVHIAVDSGMHRMGFAEGELDGVLSKLKLLNVDIGGVYSHLRAQSRKQITTFDRVATKVKRIYPNAICHLASSHSLSCKKLCYDMVRVGITAYTGAMRVESEVIMARRVLAGEFVSYGNYKCKRDTNTAVVFGGYADGLAREFPSSVYIRGRECKVLGKVCMDMCIVDCGEFLPNIGERAVLLDSDHIDKISKQRRSVSYTLMTCWRGRIERIYEYDKSRSEIGGERRDKSHDGRG